jgi:hypothetical protein
VGCGKKGLKTGRWKKGQTKEGRVISKIRKGKKIREVERKAKRIRDVGSLDPL